MNSMNSQKERESKIRNQQFSELEGAYANTKKVSESNKKLLQLQNLFEANKSKGCFISVSIKSIDLSKNDREVDINCEEFLSLKESILSEGLIQRPVLAITENANLPLECIAGHRRILALKAIELDKNPSISDSDIKIPSEIKGYITDPSVQNIRLAENLIRENLKPLELAESLKRLKINLKETNSGLGRYLNRDRKYVSRLLKIAEWSDNAKEQIRTQNINIKSLMKIASRTLSDEAIMSELNKLSEKKVGNGAPHKPGTKSSRKETILEVSKRLNSCPEGHKEIIKDFIVTTGLISSKEFDSLP